MTEQPSTLAPNDHDQVAVRLDKLQRLRARDVEPYPVGYPRSTSIEMLRNRYNVTLDPDVATGQTVSVVGRILLMRTGGKLCFATIREGEAEIQVMASLDRLGEESLAQWKSDLDRGDHIGVTGEVITSRRGELSIMVDSWAITSKCLRPLPEKFKGW